jgi:hypothetical protein
MRRVAAAFTSLLILPLLMHAQSVLDFPRAIQPAELSTTGFALVNPGSTAAEVIFTLYKTDGSVEKVSTQPIPARGQLAKNGAELFPGADAAGWVQATSSTSGLQGFWVGGDFTSFTDGAAAASSSDELVLPLVSPQSEIHIANTGAEDVTVLIETYGDEGFELAIPYPQHIKPKGFFRAELSTLVRPPNLGVVRYVRLRCLNPFAALVIARNLAGAMSGSSWAVVNAVPALPATMELNFPQVVDGSMGGANYQSIIGVTNLGSTANDVSITFTTESGTSLPPIQRTLPPSGALRETARALLGLPDGPQNGWVRIEGTLPITGFVSYADVSAGGVAVVPAQQRPQTELLFAHIADLSPWLTGVALLNADSRDAVVNVFALSTDGSLIGRANLTLPAGTKVAKLLSELVPQTQSRARDGGFVYVRSNVPLYGLELFFTRDLKILSNVAAGLIVPEITYTPPGAP